ncbi:MAG: hypothetical protein ACYTGC_16420 [Planctomycetota bacterium]
MRCAETATLLRAEDVAEEAGDRQDPILGVGAHDQETQVGPLVEIDGLRAGLRPDRFAKRAPQGLVLVEHDQRCVADPRLQRIDDVEVIEVDPRARLYRSTPGSGPRHDNASEGDLTATGRRHLLQEYGERPLAEVLAPPEQAGDLPLADALLAREEGDIGAEKPVVEADADDDRLHDRMPSLFKRETRIKGRTAPPAPSRTP